MWTPQGTGLGLAVCRMVTGLLGGCIRVSDRPSTLGGACFVVDIPVQVAPSPPFLPCVVALSSILRQYIDSVFSSNTSNDSPREALNWLESSEIENRIRPCVKRILTATDRLKFARDGGGGDFFDGLGKNLYRFISVTSKPPEEK